MKYGTTKWCYKCGGYKKMQTGGNYENNWSNNIGFGQVVEHRNLDQLPFFRMGGLQQFQPGGQKPYINSSQLNQIIERELGADNFRGYRELNPEARRRDWRQNKNSLIRDVRQNFTLTPGYSPKSRNTLTPEMESYDFNNQPSSNSVNNTPPQQPFNAFYTGQQYNDIEAPYDPNSFEQEHKKRKWQKHEKWKWQKQNPALVYENRMGIGNVQVPQVDINYQVQQDFDKSTQSLLDKGRRFDNNANLKKRWNPMSIGNAINYGVGLGAEYAGMYDRNKTQQEYMNRMLYNPLSGILPFDDMRSDRVEEGYNIMQFGGMNQPLKMKINRNGRIKFKGDINSFNNMFQTQKNDPFNLSQFNQSFPQISPQNSQEIYGNQFGSLLNLAGSDGVPIYKSMENNIMEKGGLFANYWAKRRRGEAAGTRKLNESSATKEEWERSAKKKEGGINIKPENRGKFTAWAKQRGMSVVEAANKVMSNTEDYSPSVVKMANFSKNARKWN